MNLFKTQYQLCYNITHQPTHDWCFYEAVDNTSIIVQYIYLFSVILLTIWISYHFYNLLQYRKNKKTREILGTVYTQIYFMIYFWVVCKQSHMIASIIKISINLGIYSQYMANDKNNYHYQLPLTQIMDDDQPDISSPLVWLSPIFQFFDFVTFFFILLLILFIPYKWLRKVLMNIQSNEQQISLETRKKIAFYFSVLKYVKFYLKYIRQLYFLYSLLSPFLLFFTSAGCNLQYYILIIFICQSLAILLFYIFGFKVLYDIKKNKLIKNMKQKDFKKIRNQYCFLVFVLITRIILLLLFRINFFKLTYEYDPSPNCLDNNDNHKIQTTVYLSLGASIMHIFPIIVVTYIYRPKIDEQNSSVITTHCQKNLLQQHYDINPSEEQKGKEQMKGEDGTEEKISEYQLNGIKNGVVVGQ